MDKIVAAILVLVLGVLIMLPLVALFALPVMWLWNDLVPGLFKLRAISFGEAFELLLLCGLLIKSGGSSSK